MHAHGARIALAVLSGAAVAGSLAGCTTTASMSPEALKELAAAQKTPQAVAPAATVVTATPTASATSTPKSKTKSNSSSTSGSNSSTVPTATPTKTSSPTPTPSPSHSTQPSVYEDGSYSAYGGYVSPGGYEKLQVSLTLSNDIVTTLSVTGVHVDSTAATYEARFEAGVGAVVIGKNIADVNVGAIAGSSLTATGFNQAVGKIKTSAHK